MKSKNTIELNGKRYDSVTGAIVGTSPTTTRPAAQHAAFSAAKNVDGILRSPRTVHIKQAAPAHTIQITSSTPDVPQRVPAAIQHSAAQHLPAHRPQTAHTLMRSAVTKPGEGLKKQIQIQSALQPATPHTIATKQSVNTISPSRMARATTITRSPHIRRYDTAPAQNISVTIAPLPVQTAPAHPPHAPAPRPHNKPADIFEHALANATNFVDTTARRAHYKKKARRHIASMAASSLALLLLIGFVAYQSTPSLQFKVAGLQAGVSTNMPNFKAAGFAYTGAKSVAPGKLTVGFSNANGKFQLLQQKTNWSDTDMIQNIAAVDASGTPNYAAVQAKDGTTVYRFDNTSATWIKDGQWYQVTGTGALSDNQVKNLVSTI